MAFAGEENLEATEVAVVTEEPRLVMTWRGKEIVNISRAFLNTNGAHQETDVFVEMPSGIASLNEAASENGTSTQPVPSDVADSAGVRAKWLEVLGDLNVCSQKGLVGIRLRQARPADRSHDLIARVQVQRRHRHVHHICHRFLLLICISFHAL
jgi:phosphoribosylformylglycinamidine (FGAM) synthase-like enzyme